MKVRFYSLLLVFLDDLYFYEILVGKTKAEFRYISYDIILNDLEFFLACATRLTWHLYPFFVG